MKKIIAVLTTIFLFGRSTFGIRTADEPNYEVSNDDGHIQIRHYPTLVIAQTEINAEYKTASSLGFQRLAGYIFGNNKSNNPLQ